MSTSAANEGKLPPASVWATDVPGLSELVVYNLGKTVTASGTATVLTANHIEALPLEPISASLFTVTSDPRANQIETEDAAYKSPAASGSAAPAGSGGGGC